MLESAGAVVAAVSSRRGGVSEGYFSSLNMSFSSGDDAARIRTNRKRFWDALGLLPEQCVCCSQVHGTTVVTVTEKDSGRGAMDKESALPDCDCLITDVPGLVLTMNFADCTPIWLYDPVRQAVALVHGGWRSAAQNIGAAALSAMKEAYGTEAKDVYAALGPTIRSCSFEVGKDVLTAFQRVLSGEELAMVVQEKERGVYFFNLPAAHKRLLLHAGILSRHFEDIHICTYCHDDLFFSHRKASQEGNPAGRHMALISLKKQA